MKDKLLSRLDKLESMLAEENVVPMVAVQRGNGPLEWNGKSYPDKESLHEAVTLICGNSYRKPLVIINLHQDREEPYVVQ